MKTNYDNYSIEFSRSMSRYGFKRYTWFISRPNYDRQGLYSSETVWCYTSDSDHDYDFWISENTTKEHFIRSIKSRPSTRCYNSPF